MTLAKWKALCNKVEKCGTATIKEVCNGKEHCTEISRFHRPSGYEYSVYTIEPCFRSCVTVSNSLEGLKYLFVE